MRPVRVSKKYAQKLLKQRRLNYDTLEPAPPVRVRNPKPKQCIICGGQFLRKDMVFQGLDLWCKPCNANFYAWAKTWREEVIKNHSKESKD